MTDKQLGILQHAVGADEYGRISMNSRNFYCAGEDDKSDCQALIDMGFMKRHKTTELFPYFNCSVTDAGKAAMKDASPIPPKLTRSQQRYRRFLDADLGCTFREFLAMEETH